MIEKSNAGKNLLLVGLALALLSAAAVWQFGTGKSAAQSGGEFFGADLIITPDAAHGTTSLIPPSAAGPFSQLGVINNLGPVVSQAITPLGTLRRTGNKFGDGSVVVNDQYDLQGFNGNISATGTLNLSSFESSNNQVPPLFQGQTATLLGLTAGTGTFKFNTGGVVFIVVTDTTSGAFVARVRPNSGILFSPE